MPALGGERKDDLLAQVLNLEFMCHRVYQYTAVTPREFALRARTSRFPNSWSCAPVAALFPMLSACISYM